MGLSATERSRRKRAHDRGDHGLCDLATCNGGNKSLTRGEALADKIMAERVHTDGEIEVIRQFGRTADEIDELESYLYGRKGKWLAAAVEFLDDRVKVTVVVDRASAELDRKRATLVRLLAELRQHGVAAQRATAAGTTPSPAPLARSPSPTAAPELTDGLAAARARAADRRAATPR